MKYLLTLCVVLLFTACQAQTDAPSVTPESGSPVETVETETPASPGAEEQEEAVKTVYGEISEVIGNSLTVKLMEQPQLRGGAPGEGFTQGEMPESGSITLPDGTVVEWDKDNPLDMESLRESFRANAGEGGGRFQGGERPAGGGTMIQGGGAASEAVTEVIIPGDGSSGGVRSGGPMIIQEGGGPVMIQGGGGAPGGFSRARNYTGEEIEFIIPVGVPVMTTTRGENGFEETELAMSKIKSGDVITVTYKEDGTTIDKISVSQNSSGGAVMTGDGLGSMGPGLYMRTPDGNVSFSPAGN